MFYWNIKTEFLCHLFYYDDKLMHRKIAFKKLSLSEQLSQQRLERASLPESLQQIASSDTRAHTHVPVKETYILERCPKAKLSKRKEIYKINVKVNVKFTSYSRK